LNCRFNQITGLDVSANTALIQLNCNSNQITSLDVSGNTALTLLYCDENQLTGLDVSANTALTFLTCVENQLTDLDVSANTALTGLDCQHNQLTGLDVRNGNNVFINPFFSKYNPDLKCIFVDDKDASFLSYWYVDEWSTFVETEAECDALHIRNTQNEICDIIFPNPSDGVIYIDISDQEIQKLTISDITGKHIMQETGIHPKETMLHTLDLSDLRSGVYIISIQTDEKIFASKIIKR
jgi:Leucine-rich repeat (LRR) protein